MTLTKQNKPLKEDWEEKVSEILETVYEKAIEGDSAIADWKQRTLFFNGENLKSVIKDLLSQSKSQIVEQILEEKKNHTPKSGAGRVLNYLLTKL